MSLHTRKQSRSGLADISFNNDTNTGLVSTANNHIGVMSAGQQVAAHGTDGAGIAWRMPATVKVALAAADTAGGVFAWANPMGATIHILSVEVDVTTVSTGACSLDIGVANDGTTLSDTIIDGASTATTARVIDNIKDAGTNGTSVQRCSSTQYVTGSVVGGGASAGLVGFAYITYRLA